jgi:hypothetical protein
MRTICYCYTHFGGPMTIAGHGTDRATPPRARPGWPIRPRGGARRPHTKIHHLDQLAADRLGLWCSMPIPVALDTAVGPGAHSAGRHMPGAGGRSPTSAGCMWARSSRAERARARASSPRTARSGSPTRSPAWSPRRLPSTPLVTAPSRRRQPGVHPVRRHRRLQSRAQRDHRGRQLHDRAPPGPKH